jgi:hypothetical protein
MEGRYLLEQFGQMVVDEQEFTVFGFQEALVYGMI